MNQSPNQNTGKPTSHSENPHKLADNQSAAVARLELVAYYVQLTQSHLWMHQTWSERKRERERERERGGGQWEAEQQRCGTGGDNGSCQQQRQEPTGEAIVLSCLMYFRPPFSLFGERALRSSSRATLLTAAPLAVCSRQEPPFLLSRLTARPAKRYIFLEMRLMVVSESSTFDAYLCHRRPAGLHRD